MKGYCYIIVNPGFPDWCKIGFTRRKVTQRLNEYQTYSPFQFTLYHQVEFDNPHAAEQHIHKQLKEICEQKKEWFKISPKLAANIIDCVKEDLDTYGEL